MKRKLSFLILCMLLWCVTGVLVALRWRPLPWYDWLLAALALPTFILTLIAIALFVLDPPSSFKVLISSNTAHLALSSTTTVNQLRNLLGPQLTEQWDDDVECNLAYPIRAGTITFSCSSARRSHGRLEYVEIELTDAFSNEKNGHA